MSAKAFSGKALVVLSGGQDSTTCLYWAIAEFGLENVTSVTFDYGQRHRVEIDCARSIAEFANVPNRILPIDTFATLGGDAITDNAIAVARSDDSTLPNTFVPGRNIIFLSLAAALAYQQGVANLVTGVAQTDYSGYPDCREETISALQTTLRLAMEHEFIIHTPLMHLTKAQTVLMAQKNGALGAMHMTHTCYNGERPPCRDCAACELRAQGFAEAGVIDPLLVA